MRKLLLLTVLLALVPQAAPAATNGRIVAAIGREEGTLEIWTMAPDGTDPIRLTDNDTLDDMPEFSPDGSEIVFVSNRDGDSDIFVMDVDGANVRQVVDAPGADTEPSWSPDGSRIAYVTFRHDRDHILSEIRTVRPDGIDDRRLTRNERMEFGPAWSPDGSRIAFAGRKLEAKKGYGIFVMSPAGGGATRLTTNTRLGNGGFDVHPTWSPDGRWIAFTREMDAFEYGYEIFKIRSNGRRLTRLTENMGTDQQPDWSPDGTTIVFTSDFQVALIDIDGGDKRLLTSDDQIAHYAPDWQPLP